MGAQLKQHAGRDTCKQRSAAPTACRYVLQGLQTMCLWHRFRNSAAVGSRADIQAACPVLFCAGLMIAHGTPWAVLLEAQCTR